MSAAIKTLPEISSVEQAREVVALLLEQLQQLGAENRLLRQKLDAFIRHYFGGRRNEGLDAKQIELALQGLELTTVPAQEPPPAAAAPAHARRNGSSHPV